MCAGRSSDDRGAGDGAGSSAIVTRSRSSPMISTRLSSDLVGIRKQVKLIVRNVREDVRVNQLQSTILRSPN
jgi:hypothetical protein